jgi:Papain-like cysteine protease AvrRpt2
MANRLIELQTELARHKAPPPVRARAGAHPVTRPQGLSTGRVARHARALTQRIDYAVAGTVPAIAQPSSMTCWAAATTILMSWRAGRRLDIGETMAEIGTYWRNLLDADQGITTDDKVRFLRDADLEAQQDLNPSPEGWRAMLERYGPIWVTTWETAGIHGRIVYGIHGDGSAEGTQLDVVDPAGGRRYQADIATFLPKFEREAARAGRAYVSSWST